MGIKFYCPNGHKLNVKNYLAGKKGICPYCNEKFLIPEESTKSQVAALTESQAQAPGSVVTPQTGTVHNQSAPTVNQPAYPGAPIPMPVQQAPAGDEEASAVIAKTGAPPTSAQAAESAPAPSPSLPDPFEGVSPEAAWYIRYSSGDQYGPAKTDEVKRWLDENRIAPDALVWCEGWPEWKKASETFPKFQGGGSSAVPAAPASPAPAAAPAQPASPAAPAAPQANAPAAPGQFAPGASPASPAGPVPSPFGAAPAAQPAQAAPVAQAVPAGAHAAQAVPGQQNPDDSTDTMEFLANMSGPQQQKADGDEEEQQYGPRKSNTAIIITLVLVGGLAVVGIGMILVLAFGDSPQLTARQSGGTFQVLMPFDPKQSDSLENHETSAGRVGLQTFVADARNKRWGYLFFLGHGQGFNPSNAINDLPQFFDDAARIGAQKMGGGGSPTGSPREVRIGSHPGREYFYSNMRIQVYLANGKLYILGVAGQGSLRSDVVQQYFRSFRLADVPSQRYRYQ